MNRPDLPAPNDLEAEDLRALFQSQPRTAAPDEDCPSPDTLWAAALGELDSDAARKVILHTGRCPSCAEEWRLARYLGQKAADDRADDVTPEAPHGANREARRPWPPHWLHSAAAVVVALVGAGILLWQESPHEQTLRDAPQTTVEQHAPIESLVPEDAPLPRDAAILRWRGPEDAVYTLVVTTSRDIKILVNEQRLTESAYEIPPSILDNLEPGAVLLWHLSAVLPDGSELRSGTFRVQIESRAPAEP